MHPSFFFFFLRNKEACSLLNLTQTQILSRDVLKVVGGIISSKRTQICASGRSMEKQNSR